MTLETLVASIKSLPVLKQRRVTALLGATLADTSACPLHWVYNQQTMDSTLNGSTEPEFWPESKSPFYKIPSGRPSAYNETMLASLAALKGNPSADGTCVCEEFKKRFGAGTDYADAYERRSMPNHPEKKGDFKGPIEGPWLQHAMRVLLENYEKGGVGGLGRGEEVDQHDAFCAALPFIVMHAGTDSVWSEAEKIIKLFTTSQNAKDVFHFETLLLNNYILGVVDPVGEASKSIATTYPHVLELIQKARETSSLSYIDAVTAFGKSCSMPHSFQVSMLTMWRTSSFVDAARLNICGGGCNSSRGNVVGACYGAKYGIDGMPVEWLKKVNNIEQIIKDIVHVLT
jgi:hypothetical protein